MQDYNKYVLNIKYENHPAESIIFDTYDEADEYITGVFENKHYDGSIISWDINETEVH